VVQILLCLLGRLIVNGFKVGYLLVNGHHFLALERLCSLLGVLITLDFIKYKAEATLLTSGEEPEIIVWLIRDRFDVIAGGILSV
jgi:hypothetical protein